MCVCVGGCVCVSLQKVYPEVKNENLKRDVNLTVCISLLFSVYFALFLIFDNDLLKVCTCLVSYWSERLSLLSRLVVMKFK